MKKLRLIVTEQCNRNCSECCNNDIKPTGELDDKLLKSYHMILITGGEPFLFPNELFSFLQECMFCPSKVILYTAIYPEITSDELASILYLLDGITFTIHDKKGVDDFIKLNELIKNSKKMGKRLNKRVNIFTDVQLPPINLYGWNVKFIKWIKNCPLPKDEELLILNKPWKK